MRRLNVWDGVATLAVAAIAVPYLGYIINGSMPFIKDPRGMAGTGIVLCVVAFTAVWRAARPAKPGTLELVLAGVTLTLDLAALGVAETFAADVLLAVFMGMILVTWLEEVLRHAGISQRGGHGHALTS